MVSNAQCSFVPNPAVHQSPPRRLELVGHEIRVDVPTGGTGGRPPSPRARGPHERQVFHIARLVLQSDVGAATA